MKLIEDDTTKYIDVLTLLSILEEIEKRSYLQQLMNATGKSLLAIAKSDRGD